MADTLKSTCDQCTHLNSARLDFIPLDLARNRQLILRDLQELVSAAANEQEKTVVVLAGSILEAVLYTFINAQAQYIAERRGTFEFDPNQSLQNYVSIFNRWFSDVFPNAVIPDVMVRYRDLVHFNRELASPPGVCYAASREMLRLLDVLLGEFSELRTGNEGSPTALVLDVMSRTLANFCSSLRTLLIRG